jgi:hypothetical protein
LTIGDEIVSTAEFFIGDREVGKDGVVCTKVRAPEWFQCVATNSFDEGDLTVQFLGDFTSPEPGHFAITGGTRAYLGATGEVTFVDNPDSARDNVTLRFSPPLKSDTAGVMGRRPAGRRSLHAEGGVPGGARDASERTTTRRATESTHDFCSRRKREPVRR